MKVQVKMISGVSKNHFLEVRKMLDDITAFDKELSGANPDELWIATKREKFTRNFDYCISKAEKKEGTMPQKIEKFFETWKKNDCYFAKGRVSVIEHDDLIFVSFAYAVY